MKIQYKFDEVSSNSDTIKIMANDVTVLTLNKADCTSSDSEVAYDRLISGELGPYYLEDVDCNDLTTLSATGSEGHTATFTDAENLKWKEYAHNKIGNHHFKDTKWIASCDAKTPIIVYNQDNTHTTYADFTNFIKSIPTTFATGYTLDLSNIDASKVNDNLEYKYWYYYANPFASLKSILVYSYKLPNLTSLYQVFYNFTKLKEAPEIPSSVTNMNSTFQYCTSLTTPPEIPSSVTTMDSTFYGCTGLKEIDILNIKAYNTYQMMSDCNLNNINNIVLTGGYMYAYNIKSCKHVGVITTDVLSWRTIDSVLSNSSDKSYLYIYKNYSTFWRLFENTPIKVDAVSTKIDDVLYNILPTSSGYNWWVDYINTDNVATKQITQRTLSETDHIDTLESKGVFKTKSFCPIVVVPDYIDPEKENHTFELKDFTITSQTGGTYTNCSSATIAIDSEDPLKVIASLNCTNLADNSHSKATITAVLTYNALIDGYKFLGECHVTINIDFDFTIIEEVKYTAKVIEDDSTTTEEPSANEEE